MHEQTSAEKIVPIKWRESLTLITFVLKKPPQTAVS
jgi:hypothetical protein